MTIKVLIKTLHPTALGYSLMPCINVMFFSLSVASFASCLRTWTVLGS